MANLRKFSLILMGILFAGILLVPLNASDEPAINPPPHPSFTVNLVTSSYLADAVIDPYNGSIITPSHNVTHYHLVVNITNIQRSWKEVYYYKEVYYNVQIKGFYDSISNWVEHHRNHASDSKFTIVELDADYRTGNKVVIQVQTEIEFEYETTGTIWGEDRPFPTTGIVTATGTKQGNWSESQIFTMPDAFTLAPTSTPTLSNPESAVPAITPIETAVIVLTIIILVVAVIIKKQPRTQPQIGPIRGQMT
jgi:hypothetical protein